MSYSRPIGNKPLTWGKATRKGGRRACLCENNTYHIDCCQGYLINQGIGDISNSSEE